MYVEDRLQPVDLKVNTNVGDKPMCFYSLARKVRNVIDPSANEGTPGSTEAESISTAQRIAKEEELLQIANLKKKNLRRQKLKATGFGVRSLISGTSGSGFKRSFQATV